MAVNWQMGLAPDIGGNALAAFEHGRAVKKQQDGEQALTAYATNPNDQTLNALAPHQPQFVIQQRQQQQAQQRDADEKKLIGAALNGDQNARKQLAYVNAPMYLQLDQGHKKQVDQQMNVIAQQAFHILQLPKEQQAPALAQAVQGLNAQGFDIQDLHLTGNPEQDLMTALAVTGHLGEWEKFRQPQYQQRGEAGLQGFQFGVPIPDNGGLPAQAPQAPANLPRIASPQEASKLPPGSQFILPDGRIGTVPGGQPGGATPFSGGTYQQFKGAIIGQESGGQYGVPNAEGSGAMGVGQLMPDTARTLAKRAGLAYRPDLLGGNTPEARAYQDRLTESAVQEAWQYGGGDARKAAHYYFGGSNTHKWGSKTRQYGDDVVRRMGAR